MTHENLKGRVAVVTGGGGVLCGQFAKTLAKQGCKVAILDLNEAAAQQYADEINANGGEAIAVGCNVLDQESMQNARSVVNEKLGTCDILLNGAGGNNPKGTTTKDKLELCDIADKAAEAVVRFMNDNGLRAYDEKTRSGLVKHVYVRKAVNTPDAVAVIVASGGFGARTQALVNFMRKACPELTGIVLNVNKTSGNTVLAGDFHTLWGRDYIRDSLGGIVYELAPQAFYQINPPQAEKLYKKAVEYASPEGKTVLDMYCGAGTISLFLARAAKRVIGAEIIPEAVENARENAHRNGIENADFICADASEAAEKFLRDGVRPEAIVVDPPRKGMDEAAVRALCGMAPERIVYVSCNPATLARDICVFNDCGYALRRAEAVDMFPRTAHVECCLLLCREGV